MKKIFVILLSLSMILASATVIFAEEGKLRNYCEDATVIASPNSNEAGKVSDGDESTAWTVKGATGSATLEIDFGSINPTGYIKILWTEPAAKFTVYSGSEEGVRENTVFTATDNTAPVTVIEAETVFTARYIIIEMTIPEGKDVGIREVYIRRTADQLDTKGEAQYPNSGFVIPEGSKLITGTLIGDEAGWGNSTTSGRAAAFDGDINTFFDPPNASGTGSSWCGIDAGEMIVLTGIVICPRDGSLARYKGCMIQASNDPDFNKKVTIFVSKANATEFNYIDCSGSINSKTNVGYRYFRYINMSNHGDVAEVELYGYAVTEQVTEAVTTKEKVTVAPDTEVEADTDEETVKADVTDKETEKKNDKKAAPKSNTTLIICIAAAVVVAIAVVVIVIIKKKKK